MVTVGVSGQSYQLVDEKQAYKIANDYTQSHPDGGPDIVIRNGTDGKGSVRARFYYGEDEDGYAGWYQSDSERTYQVTK